MEGFCWCDHAEDEHDAQGVCTVEGCDCDLFDADLDEDGLL